MSIVQEIWAIEEDTSLTEIERSEALTLAKAPVWLSLEMPIQYDGLTLTTVEIDGPTVRFYGSGGTLLWPLELVGFPIAIPDIEGIEVHADGTRWTLNPLAVLLGVIGGL